MREAWRRNAPGLRQFRRKDDRRRRTELRRRFSDCARRYDEHVYLLADHVVCSSLDVVRGSRGRAAGAALPTALTCRVRARCAEWCPKASALIQRRAGMPSTRSVTGNWRPIGFGISGIGSARLPEVITPGERTRPGRDQRVHRNPATLVTPTVRGLPLVHSRTASQQRDVGMLRSSSKRRLPSQH